MARRNERGLDFSFKWYGKGRKGGRWYTRIGGKPAYFGTSAVGVSDRESYDTALAKFKAAKQQADDVAMLPQKLADVDRLLRIVHNKGPLTGDDLEFCLAVAKYSDAEKQAIRAFDWGDLTQAPALLGMANGKHFETATASDTLGTRQRSGAPQGSSEIREGSAGGGPEDQRSEWRRHHVGTLQDDQTVDRTAGDSL
jgi:hypothetical protein